MLESLYTSTKELTFSGTPAFMGYVTSWDAMVLFNGASLDKIFRDGTQANLGQTPLTWGIGGRQGGRHFWMPYSTDPIDCYGADDITGQPHFDDVLNPTWPIPFGTWRVGDCLDDRLGYFLHNAGGGGLINIYRLADGYLLGSVTMAGVGLFDFLAPAGDGVALACDKESGVVALLDYVNQAWIWQSSVPVFLCAAYDSRHDLVITLQSDKKIRIFLALPYAATLADPIFVPTITEAHRLHGYKVRTRLTGAGGEPCPGYWIEWSLLGDPAKGYLEKAVSKTDQDGYAWNFYFGPAAVGDTGQETIKVKVTI